MAIRRAAAWTRRLVVRAPFEASVFALAVIYVALHLSPSSYALALGQLGEAETPLFGSPRGIRTDEWSVMTPLFEASVNNDFREINETSFYRETLRSFIGLPLLNWGLVFKPLVWPFFVVPPALAYSFFWAACAALMLIGWSVLLRELGFGRTVAGFTSATLYFSPFVQAWSGPSPLLAFFPWVLLAVVRIHSPRGIALTLSLLVPVWLLGMFYLPALPPLLFLGLALCIAFRPEIFSLRRLAGVLAGTTVGLLITFAYLAPVFRAYADSVYPGHRWATGGDLPAWQVASQFLPSTTTEHFTNLIAPNISEAATVASWLAVLVLCTVDVGQIRRRYGNDRGLRQDLRRLAVLGLMWALITLWQVLPFPPVSYILGFGLSPEARTLFASGALLLFAAAYAVDRLPLRITPVRMVVFAAVVILAWLVASLDLQDTNELTVRDELLVVPLVAGIAAFARVAHGASVHATRVALLLVALIPTMVVWGLFNPLQTTRVMFRKPDTAVTRELDGLATTRSDGAIAVSGPVDAILNGVGYRSVTHVLATPSPHLFRRYFPGLDDRTFAEIFNRYAHISLTDEAEPRVVNPDGIRLPIRAMARYAATRSRNLSQAATAPRRKSTISPVVAPGPKTSATP
jgi:hypothetical protein